MSKSQKKDFIKVTILIVIFMIVAGLMSACQPVDPSRVSGVTSDVATYSMDAIWTYGGFARAFRFYDPLTKQVCIMGYNGGLSCVIVER